MELGEQRPGRGRGRGREGLGVAGRLEVGEPPGLGAEGGRQEVRGAAGPGRAGVCWQCWA